MEGQVPRRTVVKPGFVRLLSHGPCDYTTDVFLNLPVQVVLYSFFPETWGHKEGEVNSMTPSLLRIHGGTRGGCKMLLL